jgi:hypothetical protein
MFGLFATLSRGFGPLSLSVLWRKAAKRSFHIALDEDVTLAEGVTGMMTKIRSHSRCSVVLAVLLLALFGLVQVVLGGNIDPMDKWAWGTNVGWINFAPPHGGVTVYSDHLEGYAWGENIGWIRLGSHDGGGAHTYANTAADNYGVNNDGSGILSGYAWGTTVGWINFDPANGGVTVDMTSGEFDGYAWAQNIGWIHFNGMAADFTKYKVIAWLHRVYLPIVTK